MNLGKSYLDKENQKSKGKNQKSKMTCGAAVQILNLGTKCCGEILIFDF
jgi:hypothetical protein